MLLQFTQGIALDAFATDPTLTRVRNVRVEIFAAESLSSACRISETKHIISVSPPHPAAARAEPELTTEQREELAGREAMIDHIEPLLRKLRRSARVPASRVVRASSRHSVAGLPVFFLMFVVSCHRGAHASVHIECIKRHKTSTKLDGRSRPSAQLKSASSLARPVEKSRARAYTCGHPNPSHVIVNEMRERRYQSAFRLHRGHRCTVRQ
jgi:hypothetical protein